MPQSEPDTAPGVSVIIPVFRDVAALETLLTWLRHHAAGCEVLVVDAAADPACEALCISHQALWLPATPCRGAQQNLGAAHATGDILWFLHADAAPPVGAVEALRTAIAAGASGGAFRFSLQGAQGLPPRLIEWGAALRARLGGMVYGDQGLFARREAFKACGGFAEAGLFEEVPLVRALRRQRFVLLPLPIAVSPRRWVQHGWWRGMLRNRTLALAYLLGVPAETLARWYRRPRKMPHPEE